MVRPPWLCVSKVWGRQILGPHGQNGLPAGGATGPRAAERWAWELVLVFMP